MPDPAVTPPPSHVPQDPLAPAPARGLTAWVLLVFTAVVALFFFEHLFLGRSLLPLDVLNQILLPRPPGSAIDVQTHYPIDEITQLAPNAKLWRESVRRGELPLWNPHIFGGNPHQASGIWGVLTPFKLPLLFGSLERAYTWTLVAQFWIAGLGMFWCLREFGRSPIAAGLGALCWTLSSNFLLFHWLYLNVFLWMPFALACWERALSSKSSAWLAPTSLFLALALVGGSMQFTVFAWFWWGFLALTSFNWRHPADRVTGVRWIAIVSTLGLLLSAAQWVPLLEFLPQETQRFRNLEPGAASLKHTLLGLPALVATFLFPALAGSPRSFDLLKFFGGNQIDFNGAIGVIPWTLVAIGFLAWKHPRKKGLLTLAAVVVALVFLTPLQRFLYHRFLLLAVFVAIVLAAAGWDALAQNNRADTPRFTRVFTAFSLVAALLLASLFVLQFGIEWKRPAIEQSLTRKILDNAAANQFGGFPEWLKSRVPALLAHFRPANPEFLIPIGCLLAAGLAARKWNSKKLSLRTLQCTLALLSLADLSLTLRNRVPRVDVARYPFYAPPTLLKPALDDPDVFRIYRWIPSEPLLFRDNLLWAFGLTGVTGYDSMAPDGLKNLPVQDATGFNALLDLANAKYILTDSKQTLPTNRFQKLGAEHNAALWLNRHWRQRVQFYPQTSIRHLPSRAEVWNKVQTSTWDPTTEILLEQPASTAATSPTVPTSPSLATNAAIQSLQVEARHVRFRKTGPVPGVCVISQTWYPGWKARVDGRPVPVLRVNGVLQGVEIQAGDHDITVDFQPDSWRLGLMLSALGFVGVAVVWVRRQSAKSPPAS